MKASREEVRSTL